MEPKTSERQKWIRRFEEESRMASDHVYDQRYLAICRDIVGQMADPSYEPPTFEEIMEDAPWGP